VTALTDMLRRGIYTPEQATSWTGLRTLGVLPFLKKRGRKGLSQSMMALAHPLGEHAEALRSLSVALMTGPTAVNRQVVLITSALPGEGKTSLAVSLGRLGAAAGKSLLVIEGDLRRPSLCRALEVAPEIGLVEFLTGNAALADVIRTDAASGMAYISSGGSSRFPAELLVSDRMALLLREVRHKFDLIIIDSPPVGIVSDALVLSTQADATLMVLRWAHTPRQALSVAIEKLGSISTDIAGVVLSHVQLKQLPQYGSIYGRLDGAKSYFAGAAE